LETKSEKKGIGKSYFGTDRFDEAIGSLEWLLGEYPESGFAQEAIYLRGVCRYKKHAESRAPQGGIRAAHSRISIKRVDETGLSVSASIGYIKGGERLQEILTPKVEILKSR